eukprot:747457-Hanusia_phi.AAC.4
MRVQRQYLDILFMPFTQMVHTLEGSTRSEASTDPLAVRSPSFKSTPKKRAGEAGAAGSAKKSSPFGARKTETKKTKSFTEKEPLSIILNVYDLVWDKDSEGGRNAGLADLGLGFYHTGRTRLSRLLKLMLVPGLEIWGKEISFGHSRRYRSGVFAVKPKRAQEYMPNTRYKMSIEMDSILMSRLRLAMKYTSDSYDVLRCNCNHFTDDLCMAICGKAIPEWVNRPARMGASALDALHAPLKAMNSLVNIFRTESGSENQSSIDLEREISKIAEVPVNAENISSNPSQSKAFDTNASSFSSPSSSSEQSMKSWIASQVPDTAVMMEEKENQAEVRISAPPPVLPQSD